MYTMNIVDLVVDVKRKLMFEDPTELTGLEIAIWMQTSKMKEVIEARAGINDLVRDLPDWVRFL